ncbi:MAG: hypothetical protein ABIK83_06015 [Candidatus Zixiibacteriota bacterium]
MPFCPKCKYEYKANIDECPDCGEELVDSLSEHSDFEDEEVDSDEEWIALAKLTSNQYADMVVEALQAKDIPAIVHSKTGHFGSIGTMGPSSYVSAGDGYLIMVPREFAELADEEAGIILGDVWTKSRLKDSFSD